MIFSKTQIVYLPKRISWFCPEKLFQHQDYIFNSSEPFPCWQVLLVARIRWEHVHSTAAHNPHHYQKNSQYVFFWQEVRDISVIKREQSYAGNKLVVLGEVIVFISSPVVDC